MRLFKFSSPFFLSFVVIHLPTSLSQSFISRQDPVSQSHQTMSRFFLSTLSRSTITTATTTKRAVAILPTATNRILLSNQQNNNFITNNNFNLIRSYAAGGQGLNKETITSRIHEVLKSFEKVDPTKVSVLGVFGSVGGRQREHSFNSN